MARKDSPPPPVTRRVAEFASAGHDLPPGVARQAGRAALDTVGVAVAGASEAAAALTREIFEPLPIGPAYVFGGACRTTPQLAALLNATAAHALDFDDVSHAVKGHPSTVLIPALLAVAEEVRPDGAAFAEAFAVGLQVSAALWSGLGADHYARGWHATATVGVVGAAAAVSRLYGHDTETTETAVGVAASFAAGSRQNFGTMTKPLHAGHAAEWGVRASRLAGRGFTADRHQLEGPLGFLAVLGDARGDAAIETLEAGWVLEGHRGLNVKKYPCCYFAHRAVDAALQLPVLGPEAIADVRVTVPPGTTSALRYPTPATGLEGKFSGPYLVAAGLLDRRVDLASFTDEAVRRPDVLDVARTVTWVESDVPPMGAPAWSEGYAVVELRDRSGGVHRARVDVPHGDCRDPLTDEELVEKFTSAVSRTALGPAPAGLAHGLLSLHRSADVGSWAEPFTAATWS